MRPDRVLFGVCCRWCKRKTLNRRGICCGCLQKQACPKGIKSPRMAAYGQTRTTSAGIELSVNDETNRGADEERQRRVSAYRWWLSARHSEGRESSTLPRNLAWAVLAWEAAGCPRDREEATELAATRLRHRQIVERLRVAV